MCTVATDFTTITGTKRTLDWLDSAWEKLDVVRGARERDLHFALRRAGLTHLHPSFEDPASPHVAIIWHTGGCPTGAVGRLNSELLLLGMPVVCEQGYYFALSGGPVPGGRSGRPTVAIDQNAAGSARVATLPRRANGNRVAVLDTGDLRGYQPTMADLTLGFMDPKATPDDIHGHGTAVADLITTINPTADVYPIRVVDANLATSYHLLCGLSYAMWTQQFAVVNVSLSAHTPGGCATVQGTSLEIILAICRQNGVPMPLLVAAAGNTITNQSFGYPAQLPDAIVVLANDWNGNPATYNVVVPAHIQPIYASGGDQTNSFGTITLPGQTAQQIFGTSFAAAVVTANII